MWMFVHPFDVLKVQLQLNEGGKRKNPITACIETYQSKGVRNGLCTGAHFL